MAEPGIPMVDTGTGRIGCVFLWRKRSKYTERIGIIKQNNLCYDKNTYKMNDRKPEERQR